MERDNSLSKCRNEIKCVNIIVLIYRGITRGKIIIYYDMGQ